VSMIDEVVAANGRFAESFKLGHIPAAPARKLAVVTCMDARINVEQALGLNTGDAHIIRNAGGIVTEDVLRSLVVSHYLLYTNEFMVINHTGCGQLAYRDEELCARVQAFAGTASVAPYSFYAFTDLAENVRQQVQKIRSHPWVPKQITTRGFIYDVETGRLSEVYVP